MKAILINLAIICLLFSCLVLATESQSDNEKEFLSDLNLISWLLKKKKSKDFGVLADDDKINCPTNVIKGISDSALDYSRCYIQYPGRASCSACGNKFRSYLNWMSQCPNDERIKAMLDAQKKAWSLTC